MATPPPAKSSSSTERGPDPRTGLDTLPWGPMVYTKDRGEVAGSGVGTGRLFAGKPPNPTRRSCID